MKSIVPLSFEKHGKLREIRSHDYRRFKDKNFVPIMVQDFYALATEFVLPFVRNSETGEFVPVAMMGLNKGQNLYCQDQQWRCHVLPLGFTADPFSVSSLDPQTNDVGISIDESSPRLSDSDGEALYNADGSQTDYLKKRIEHVVDLTRQTLQTRAICNFLADKKLLKERPLTLQHRSDQARYQIEGIFTIDEEKLNAMSDEDFGQLRTQGLLPIIYSHLTSLQQINRLSAIQFKADQES